MDAWSARGTHPVENKHFRSTSEIVRDFRPRRFVCYLTEEAHYSGEKTRTVFPLKSRPNRGMIAGVGLSEATAPPIRQRLAARQRMRLIGFTRLLIETRRGTGHRGSRPEAIPAASLSPLKPRAGATLAQHPI